MNAIKQLLRLVYINHILAKNGLDHLIVSLRLFAPLRFIVYLNPWNWYRREPLTHGQALRKTLEELGPIFVKFGQALSTRPDILPPEIAKELCTLQDGVPPFTSEEALVLVTQAFKRPVLDVFASFDPIPLASASMAQVHAATLKTGEDVVVKILRPNMRKIINKDIGILRTIAKLADTYWPESRRLKPREVVDEFERTLLDELDLEREAANGAQLRRNFQHSSHLYIPEIYWDYVRPNVLVMERIYGIPVADIPQMNACGINIKLLAERGIEIFFTQVFRDCFFHADMHPGNIFVSPLHPQNPQYICIDFGIIGTLNEHDKRYLAENLMAFFNRDYHRVAQLHVESGWVARNTRIEEFESHIRTVCEPIFEKPLKDISFALVVLKLFQVARRFQMEVQPQLVLLQKTLFAVEGLGRQLYPELDLWTTAKPYLERWLKEQIGPKLLLKHLRNNIPFMIEQLPEMPRLIQEILVLHKKQYEQQVRPNFSQSLSSSHYAWRRGLGIGIFVALLVFGEVCYINYFSHEKLAIIAFGTALAGGFLAILNKRS
jgi:ubiquinone biosynthesis protein